MGANAPISTKKRNNFVKSPKEFLYVGHYIDENGNFMLKIGTTNDLKRRKQEHTRNYQRAKLYKMPKGQEFEYDCVIKLSKYNTIRFEDKTRKAWQEAQIGDFVRNDRFCCKRKPAKVYVTIRKTYEITL